MRPFARGSEIDVSGRLEPARRYRACGTGAKHSKFTPYLKNVDLIAREEDKMSDDQTPKQVSGIITVRSDRGKAAKASETANVLEASVSQASRVPATARGSGSNDASNGDLNLQLQIDGTKAVIALCGRTKAGSLEALRIYENEQFAAADCALAEKIANEKFWLSPVTLFPSDKGGSDSTTDAAATPIHVLCLTRPDGSIEALRAFENADNASADLNFFRNISNDKMWISVVQYKTVT